LLSPPHLGLAAGYRGLGDAGQIFIGHLLEGGIGVAVAGAILFCLSRPKAREIFT